MKKWVIVLCIILILLFAFLLTKGFSYLIINQLYNDLGNRDWHADLNNGFIIQQINGHEVVLIKDNWNRNSNIVISENITSFCYNERYIGVMCAKETDGVLSIYLVDTIEEIVFGPYTKTEYQDLCVHLQLEQFGAWFRTDSKPEIATFD